MVKVAIHCNQIDWQKQYAKFFQKGFALKGVEVELTPRDVPVSGAVNIVFKTTLGKIL